MNGAGEAEMSAPMKLAGDDLGACAAISVALMAIACCAIAKAGNGGNLLRAGG